MHVVTIHQAKTHLSNLIKAVQAGDEVVIARGKIPLVRLVLLDEARPKRQFGTAEGLISMEPGFDEPLADFEEYR
jgi:prevent-host-death family protein